MDEATIEWCEKNAHIPDEEVAKDIADTEREILQYQREEIAPREYFVKKLRTLQEYRSLKAQNKI